ncbi:MAG: BrnT family toxin [Microcystis aeruginosa Ma_QC_Ch_20071001_M135]|nr:MAG: BrnT family toxin [Microcystis aeruginosa Ma_QC_Ch_20071001_M135]
MTSTFDWDSRREADNKAKHGVDFETAQYAFFDPRRYRDGVIRIFGAAEWRKWRKFYEEHNP